MSTILPISGTMPVVRKLPGEDAEEAEPIAGANILSVDRKSTCRGKCNLAQRIGLTSVFTHCRGCLDRIHHGCFVRFNALTLYARGIAQ